MVVVDAAPVPAEGESREQAGVRVAALIREHAADLGEAVFNVPSLHPVEQRHMLMGIAYELALYSSVLVTPTGLSLLEELSFYIKSGDEPGLGAFTLAPKGVLAR